MNNTTKHTAGPWTICELNTPKTFGSKAKQLISFPSNLAICELYSDREKPNHVETMEANARLIAAAPELLDALKLCAGILRVGSHGAGTCEAYEAAFQAISKATGE